MNAKLIAVLICAGALASPARGQTAGVPFDPDQPVMQQKSTAKGKQQTKAAATKPAGEATATANTPQGDASPQLRARVDQLEEQLVDIQVTMGTLESLARGGVSPTSAASRTGGGGGADSARVEALEMQIRALTSQVEQMSQQLRNLRGGTSGSLPPSPGTGFASNEALPPPASGGFGATTVKQGDDQIGELISGDPNNAPPARQASAPPARAGFAGAAPGMAPPMVAPISATQGGSEMSAKQLYETAYGQLLQQDYVSAESGFGEFLQRFPNDQLAGNAQYWLGETYFVRGQYKPAANAFLKGFQNYAKSSKAPDSLLKLAMSLERLGQKDAACSTFGELNTRFPNAPAHVKNRVLGERARIGCPA